MSTDPLGMEPDEMRRLGYWVVDQAVDVHEMHEPLIEKALGWMRARRS